jgi:hypothetical protein
MKFNFKILGGSLLATGPLIINFGPVPAAWWIGFFFTTLGPFLMAIELHAKPKPSRKPTRKKTSRHSIS